MSATTTATTSELGGGPLAGVTVIDMTHALAGPFATMLLGDLGASVYKIERPGQGDHARIMPPVVGGMGIGFAAANRNKHSVAIDVSHPEGRDLLLALAQHADALVHNYRPGVMEKLGLSAEAFRSVNPGLVYAAISGFGQSGPWRRRPAFDPTMQALAGVSAITGSPGEPAPAGIAVADLIAPLFTVIGVVSGLYEARGGRGGRTLDVGMFDALFNMHAHRLAIFDAIGKVPTPSGARRAEAFPMGTFATADGFIVIAALTERFWLNLCAALDRPDWNDPDCYGSMRARSKKRDQLFAELQAIFQERTTAEWSDLLIAQDVPCGAVTDYPELVTLDLVADRGLLTPITIESADGDTHEVNVPARPLKWSDFDMGVRLGPPRLGEHTQPVLERELGLSRAEIGALAKRDIIAVDAGTEDTNALAS